MNHELNRAGGSKVKRFGITETEFICRHSDNNAPFNALFLIKTRRCLPLVKLAPRISAKPATFINHVNASP
jgi:hypothetical protein